MNEARAEVEKVFGVGCRKEALRKTLDAEKRSQQFVFGKISPAFIPISAVQAFIHQTASLMTLEKFKSFDKDLIEKLGRDQFGKQMWKKWSPDEKVENVYDIISNAEQYQEGLKDSNFDKFMVVLRHFVGGDQAQRELIQKQIHTGLSALSKRPFLQPGNLTTKVQEAYERCKLLAGTTENNPAIPGDANLKKAFWTAYTEYEGTIFQEFESSWPEQKVELLAGPMKELLSYHKLVRQAEWEDEKEPVVVKMKALVRRLFGFLVEQENKTGYFRSWWTLNKDTDTPKQTDLSPLDWAFVWGSILLLSYDRHFCEVFGREKILFEKLAQNANAWRGAAFNPTTCPYCLSPFGSKTGHKHCGSCKLIFTNVLPWQGNCISCYRQGSGTAFIVKDNKCYNCGTSYREPPPDLNAWLELKYNAEGKLTPVHPDKYKKIIHVEVPESLSDPKHFGHLVYKFCRFMESIEDKQSQVAQLPA